MDTRIRSILFIIVAVIVVGMCNRLSTDRAVTPSEKQQQNQSLRSGSEGQKWEETLRSRLAYLSEIPEVAWHEIDGNNVYICWLSIPDDFRLINTAAALAGNRAINFGVHVWSVQGVARGWRPSDGPWICETTARYGEVKETSCR